MHTKEQVEEAFASAISVSDAAVKLGLSGNYYRKIDYYAKIYSLNKPVYVRPTKGLERHMRRPLEDVLTYGSHYSSNALKHRLVKAGILQYVCNICDLNPDDPGVWQDIVLQLDHINGDSVDNQLDNLRILCPNCHSQTSTYGSKSTRYDNQKSGKCQNCGRGSKHSKTCWRCNDSIVDFPTMDKTLLMFYEMGLEATAQKLGMEPQALKSRVMAFAKNLVEAFGSDEIIANTAPLGSRKKLEILHQDSIVKTPPKKAVYPPVDELIAEINASSFVAVAERLGVSDNAVRKYIERKAGKDAIPRGYAKNPKPKPLTKGQKFLASADVKDVITEIEKPGNSIKTFSTTHKVSEKALRDWLEEKLGYRYVPVRNKQTLNPKQGRVEYPEVDVLLGSIANNGAEYTAKSLGVTSKAVERHLRKHLPPEAFPLLRSGFLASYKHD